MRDFQLLQPFAKTIIDWAVELNFKEVLRIARWNYEGAATLVSFALKTFGCIGIPVLQAVC